MSGWWRNRAGYARVGLDGEEDASARDAASSPPLSRAEKAEASAALGGFFGEGVAQLRLALPVSLSMICNRVMSLTSVAFVGHLGSLPLAGAALATTLGNVTGNSVMVGMASACSTLGGQAFGAERYSELGRVTQRALVILTLAACPIALSWSAAEPALLALGQDPAIARASATYLETLIPGLFFYAWNVVLQAYMQSQGITKPGAVAGVVAALLHVPANVAFIRGAGLGFAGAGLATSWSNGVVLSINAGYLAFAHQRTPFFTPHAHKTWDGWSAEAALTEWGPFLRLALPGILMMAEWWASEANILIAGWLPDPELNVAAVSIFQVTNALAFMIPVGFSVAVLTRASNELGAGRGARARHASGVAHAMVLGVEVLVSAAILSARRRWASLYTDDERVVRSVARLLVPLAVYTAFDGVLCVASGVIKACGKQWVAGPVVFLAYYVVGIPAACWLAFEKGRGAVGLAVGATVGTTIHSVIIVCVVLGLDWRKEAARASARGGARDAKGGADGEWEGAEERREGDEERALVKKESPRASPPASDETVAEVELAAVGAEGNDETRTKTKTSGSDVDCRSRA